MEEHFIPQLTLDQQLDMNVDTNSPSLVTQLEFVVQEKNGKMKCQYVKVSYTKLSHIYVFFFLILFVNLLIFQKLTAVLPVFFLMDIMNWKERFKDQLFTLDVMME